MKLIVVKGVAGLGNRLKSLGAAVDLSEVLNCSLHIDWRDPDWRRDFSDSFQLHWSRWKKDMPKEQGSVFPSIWKTKDWTTLSAKEAVNGDVPDLKKKVRVYFANFVKRIPVVVQARQTRPVRFTTDSGEEATNPDILLWTNYGYYEHSDILLNVLDLSDSMRDKVAGVLKDNALIPGEYEAWHYRNTDRDADKGPDDFIEAVSEASMNFLQVVCTDHAYTANALNDLNNGNIVCLSRVPSFKCGGGPHHRSDKVLESQNMTKDEVNASAIVDLFLLGLAKKRTYLCRQSTFRGFVEKALQVDWFQRVLNNRVKGA